MCWHNCQQGFTKQLAATQGLANCLNRQRGGKHSTHTSVGQLSHLRNLTQVWHGTCGSEKRRTAHTGVCKQHLPAGRAPAGHTQLQASGCELGFLVCSHPLIFFSCPETYFFYVISDFTFKLHSADLFITLFFCHDLKQCLLILYFNITLLLGGL